MVGAGAGGAGWSCAAGWAGVGGVEGGVAAVWLGGLPCVVVMLMPGKMPAGEGVRKLFRVWRRRGDGEVALRGVRIKVRDGKGSRHQSAQREASPVAATVIVAAAGAVLIAAARWRRN